MPPPIDRDEVQRLLAERAQLVEVLPQPEFEEEHLPGAINIPLKTLDAETTRRLESIGFTKVYDYVAGKADWGSFGLPLEGTKGARAGEYARADVPTCRLEERLQD